MSSNYFRTKLHTSRYVSSLTYTTLSLKSWYAQGLLALEKNKLYVKSFDRSWSIWSEQRNEVRGLLCYVINILIEYEVVVQKCFWNKLGVNTDKIL